VLGQGPWSDELQLMATNPPSTPTLTFDQNSRTLTSVTLQFAPGSDNGGKLTQFVPNPISTRSTVHEVTELILNIK
jgi:hypothetical protein